MADPILWPRRLLRPKECNPNPAPTTTAGPASLSGFRQVIASPAAIWRISYESVIVASPAQRMTMRALAALVEGRANPILLPIFDRLDLRPINPAHNGSAPHDDGTPFDDGTEYSASRAEIVVDGPVAMGASQMTAVTVVGEAIQPGMHFSAGHRLYRVKKIIASTGPDTTFSFWPPAREAIAAGTELEWDEPVCKVRLLEDSALDLALDHGRHGFPNIDFIEDPS